MTSVDVTISRLAHGEGLPLPDYASAGAAGVDLRAATRADEPLVLPPMGQEAVPTGVVIALPEGYEAQIRPRSGLALNHSVTCLNSPGTIDSDYRGEIKVILINLGRSSFIVRRGDRIAQLVVAPVSRVRWIEGPVGETLRGAKGFGSTGGQ
ncbi:MAG: dUTP diphosphatase [Aestuariivirgaceae bacterium]